MAEPLWSFEQVSLAGRFAKLGAQPRLVDVTLRVPDGLVAVIGDSGAGKTSLLNLMSGFETPTSGRVRFEGAGGERLPMFVVPQDDGLWPGVTVRRHLELVAPGQGDGGQVSALLNDFDLEGIAGATPESLSRGEAARVAVARALASKAAVLVLDEPLSHVDSTRRGIYWERLLAHCRETETSLVFASHEPADVLRYSEQAIVVRGGRVVFQGPTRELYESPQDPALAAILGPVNWLAAGDRAEWRIDCNRGGRRDGRSGETILREIDAEWDSPCVRPERLSLEPDESSDVSVVRSRSAGMFAETDVRCGRLGEERRFVHSPGRDPLAAGTRVRAVILGLLALLMLAGCDEGASGPPLDVESVRGFVLPADGAKIPVPRDVAVGANGEWIILDNAGRVLIYDSAGEIDRQWRMPESSVGNPEGACLLSGGRIAIADTHYHRVVVFDYEGTVLTMFGERGREPGQFIYPVAIVTDDDGNLYVAEYGGNDRIQKFSPDFEFLTAFGSFGTQEGQFQRPSGMVWSEGVLYVVDAFNSRVHRFSDTGENLGLLSIPGARLHYPYDIARGPGKLLSIIEYGAGRLTVVTREGEVIGRFDGADTESGRFSTPWGLSVAESGRMWVADTGNRRIVEIIPGGTWAEFDSVETESQGETR